MPLSASFIPGASFSDPTPMHRPLDVDFKSEVPFANASFEKPPEIRRLNAAKFSLYARAHPNSNYNHQFLIISFIISSYRIPMLILIPKKKKKKKTTFSPTYDEWKSARGVNWRYHAVNPVSPTQTRDRQQPLKHWSVLNMFVYSRSMRRHKAFTARAYS